MARKGENIYKRKDGRWEGRYIKSRSLSGKASYGYVYAKTYQEVKKKLREAAVSERAKRSVLNNFSYVSFESIALEWFDITKTRVKESTSNKYWNLLIAYIFPALGSTPISEITHSLIENLCNELLLSGGSANTGLSAKTVNDVLSLIRNVMRYAVNSGKLSSFDTQAIQIRQHPREMRVLSRFEQDKLCKYLYANINPCNVGILICLFTGLRIGEICALRWEDISFSDRTIHVHQTMQRLQNRSKDGSKTRITVTSPKSACSIRTIPIPDELLEIMAVLQSTKTGFFLTNSSTVFLEPRTMQNRFKQVLRKSDIAPANYHALRHTFATRCVELGFDIKSLSEILGHASVNITMNRYVHPSMDLKKENMQRLTSLFSVK